MDKQKDNKEYKKQSYWDARFQSEETYDWLAKYNDVDELIAKYIKPDDRVLLVGCGNSTFSADLYAAGYKNLTNLDFSSVVIENMRKKHEDKPEMKWIVGDMTKLAETFDSESFDIVLDKAAMDALMCDEGDVWSPPPAIRKSADEMCRGIQHVLTASGLFIQISFGQPHFRKVYLLGDEVEEDRSVAYGWHFSYHKIGSVLVMKSIATKITRHSTLVVVDVGLGYFFYVMQR